MTVLASPRTQKATLFIVIWWYTTVVPGYIGHSVWVKVVEKVLLNITQYFHACRKRGPKY
jgi:hypothetical protein